jgi:hypothetical protein
VSCQPYGCTRVALCYPLSLPRWEREICPPGRAVPTRRPQGGSRIRVAQRALSPSSTQNGLAA